FATVLPAMLSRLAEGDVGEQPLLESRAHCRRVAILVLTSNRGLCGPLNSNLLRKTVIFLRERKEEGVEADIHMVGKKGIAYFRFLGMEMASRKDDLSDQPSSEDADAFAELLVDDFLSGKVDEVHIAYPHFKNAAEQPAVIERILPLAAPEEEEEEAGSKLDFIMEPGRDALLAELLPLYLRNSFFRILLEAAASEQGARRTAMKAATDSAEEMLSNLTRSYNKARQAAITTELLEIVGGAEALK
ncbi:MAG: ATP synthase F1 subunit gamma, partial [Candidatus Krumholzibacteria bacterium]|nr:ATP synthase F1 subunit gamma [Candidatus Krumholzibacteria bacterium]